LEQKGDQQIITEAKTQIVEQINKYLQAGDYARAMDWLRGAGGGTVHDAELSELERLAQDGVKRKADADRLITESQELFAQRKSAEAIQLLRQAYELDKRNSLARSILANALVEHAHTLVESDWLKAETLTNQALALNPAHPTAKTILNLIVERKTTSSVEDWVSQARKLQSSGDLFGALAWVAEGLAVHPHDPKLLQIQDAVQRDQDARRRQARRGDLDDLRRMQHEIDKAADIAAKQALAARIQAVAAKHWTDGEILSIANALLLRLGLVSQESTSASPRSKGGTLILHVPRPGGPKAAGGDASQIPPSPNPQTAALPTQAQPSPVQPSPVQPSPISLTQVLPTSAPNEASPHQVSPQPAQLAAALPSPAQTREALPEQPSTSETPPRPGPTEKAAAAVVPNKVPPSKVPLRTPPRGKARISPADVKIASAPATVVGPDRLAVAAKVSSRSSRSKQPPTSNSATLIVICSAAAMVLVAATFFFTRKHYAPTVASIPVPAPTASEPAASAPAVSAPATSTPAVSDPAQPLPEPSASAVPSSNSAAERVAPNAQSPAESGQNVGGLLVVAGQDGAKIFLNGKLQRQLTQSGQLRLPNLEPKDYVVEVSKSGFQDPPAQKIRIRKSEEARLDFHLQPQPRLALLIIQGGTPGTTVLVDQTPLGTVQPDGTLSVSTVNPGDHTVELHKERFKPKQFKKHFVAGTAISLTAADAALDAAPGELKITFAPADSKVAIVKGDFLKVVSSGVPLSLAAGTYTLSARTADGFMSSATLDVLAGQSKTLDLSFAPNGMSKWDDPGAWKREKDAYSRKGGNFVLYGVAPTSGTFVFSAMLTKGHLLQWVFNYADAKNYLLFQMDDNNFYRSVIRNGQKTDEVIVPHKVDKKSVRTLHIRVSPTEIVHQIKRGESWTVLDRWTQPGVNLSQGKFGFYLPGDDQVAVSSFAHYGDLNIR